MNQVRLTRLALFVLITLGIALASAPAQAQTVEVEPNSTCLSAQPLDALPATVAGSLDTPPDTPDVDYYRINATPGDRIQIDQRGWGSGSGTLLDSFLGAFNSACELLNYDDEGGPGQFESRIEIEVPADGVLVVAASSIWDFDFSGNSYYSGTYTLSASKLEVAKGLGGRIVNAKTGAVPNAVVYLQSCDNGACWQYEGYTYSGPDGSFRFEPGNFTLYFNILRAGEYRLIVNAGSSYQIYEGAIFELLDGQDLDLGNLGVEPVPVVGSIRGRLVDAVTGDVLPGSVAPFGRVELQNCPPGYGWCWTVRYGNVDALGNFLFESNVGAPLSPGIYQVVASADQYQPTTGAQFEVAADQHLDLGDFPVKSFPVRIHLTSACSSVPVTGGSCPYVVRVTNGNPSPLKGSVWSLVRSIPRYWGVNSTEFQAGTAKNVNLAPGASVDLPFSFTVPASLEDGTAICARAFTSEKKNPFETIGTQDLFCVAKVGQGFQVMPDEEKRELMKKVK
ncbi:MAG TPA: carboxypeptidase-like regulatory domain-containing protein [Thermoanaerobaculia bacterium]|nr:carboxypeptidase-like regulatory domain-containing protein [Thermoanaerobaculia bacterium]